MVTVCVVLFLNVDCWFFYELKFTLHCQEDIVLFIFCVVNAFCGFVNEWWERKAIGCRERDICISTTVSSKLKTRWKNLNQIIVVLPIWFCFLVVYNVFGLWEVNENSEVCKCFNVLGKMFWKSDDIHLLL